MKKELEEDSGLYAAADAIKGVSAGVAYASLIPEAAFLTFLNWGAWQLWQRTSGEFPLAIAVGLGVFSLVLLAASLIDAVRISTVNVRISDSGTKPLVPIQVKPDERVERVIGGVQGGQMRGGYNFFAKATIENPENALIVTDRQIVAVVVPVVGSDRTLAGSDVGGMFWMFGAGKLKQMLLKMLEVKSLDEVCNSHPANYAMDRNGLKVEADPLHAELRLTSSGGLMRTFFIRNADDIRYLQLLGN